MMRKINTTNSKPRSLKYLLVASLLASLPALAGDKLLYPVSDIPVELLKNANAVKRIEEIKFEIVGVGKAREYHKYALTVLNENGNKYASLVEYYDKLRAVESIDGTLYDASGKKIKSLKKADIEDYSGNDGGSLIEDNRVKFHNFYYKAYPYTVEYEVEIKYNYTLFYPRWMPQEAEHFAVQQSRITVICPSDRKFRYKSFNYAKEPVIVPGKSNTSYAWEITGLPAMESEYLEPEWNEITPAVYMGPEQFEVQGYQGNMQTWQDFGKFVFALKEGRDVLPDEIKQKVHALTDAVTAPREKIRLLYEFMQQNTRYVSVQLGIGGWQPFDAKYVAAKKYGDCKALSNYMYSLLKECGIRSYYTLAKAGRNAHYLVADFPCSQFNHVILCVPQKKDTIWLECTSQTLPSGYLSNFTSDRYVLLVDSAGGKLVRTPKYSLKDNLEIRKIAAVINSEGNLTATVNTQYKGQQQDEVEQYVNGLSKDKLMEYLKTVLDLPTYDVNKFNYMLDKAVMPSIYESLDLIAPGYAQISGKRLFVNPDIMTRSQRRLRQDDSRKYPLELSYEFKDIDTAEIKIPEGYTPESVPGDVHFECKFGAYNASVKIFPDKIIYYRSHERFSGSFPATDYAELVKFYELLFKADHNRIVMVKK